VIADEEELRDEGQRDGPDEHVPHAPPLGV
jgi:hypothetical protein